MPDFLIIYQRHKEGALCLAFPEKQMALWVLAGDRCEVSGAGGLVWHTMQIWLHFASLQGATTKWKPLLHPVYVCARARVRERKRGGVGRGNCEVKVYVFVRWDKQDHLRHLQMRIKQFLDSKESRCFLPVFPV